MARPRKQTVDYFPHDTDASHRKTLTVLQNKYGNDGYAFWYQLLELLGRSPGHSYNFKDPADWEFLVAETHVSDTETAKGILETLAVLRAIDPELHQAGIIWSQNFVDRLEDVYDKRKELKPDKPIIGAETIVSEAEILVSGDDNPQMKLNKTILNNEETDRDNLYKILEGTRGFPKYSQENLWKLEDVMRDYPGVNYLLEFKKFREYWNTRKLKRPWLALRNWLGKAKESKVGKAKGRGLPSRQDYTKIIYADD